MARANATRRAMPPDISDGMRWRAPRSPTVRLEQQMHMVGLDAEVEDPELRPRGGGGGA